MIIYPHNWQHLGKEVTLDDIDSAMRQVISEIDCFNLSFSGGVDSSLLLYYLLEVKGKARTFTVANDIEHPDIEYSRKSIEYYEKRYQVPIDHAVFIRPKLEDNELVKAYYGALSPFVRDIITGDCVDELCCGYYKHQDMREETYHEHLHRLQSAHLYPLNKNSGNVDVYLPYAHSSIANLFYRIPLYEKVSETCRKMVIMRLSEGKVPLEIIERRKYGLAQSYSKAEIRETVSH